MDFYKIILINGFSQNDKNFNFLKSHLTSLGFSVDVLNLPLIFDEISVSENILDKRLNEIIKYNRDNRTASEVVLIGFGIGGAVIKKVLQNKKFINLFVKVVLISTPCKKPQIAIKLHYLVKIFSKILKPLKVLLDEKYLEAKISKNIPTGIIRGTEPECKVFQPFILEPNDGIFQKDEVTFRGKNVEVLDIPFGRYSLLKRRGTAEYIVDFIETGKFKFE